MRGFYEIIKNKSRQKPANSFPEVSFITCRRRKNQPKISPQVCEKRCQRLKGCADYFDYIQPALFGRYDRRQAKNMKNNSSEEEKD